MDAMNNIIAVNWQATEPHWTADSSPSDSKFSLILVYARSGLVAFSVYRTLRSPAGRHLPERYRVLPAHQVAACTGFSPRESEVCRRQ